MERKINVDVSHVRDQIQVNVTGHSDIYTHTYDSVDDAVEDAQGRLRRHATALRVVAGIGGTMMVAGSYLMISGLEKESTVLCTVGTLLASGGAIGIIELTQNGKDRKKELEQEITQLLDIQNKQTK